MDVDNEGGCCAKEDQDARQRVVGSNHRDNLHSTTNASANRITPDPKKVARNAAMSRWLEGTSRMRGSARVYPHPARAAAGRRPHDDLDVASERCEPGQESIRRKSVEPAMQEVGHLRLVDSHEFRRGALGESARCDDSRQFGRQACLDQPNLRYRQPEIKEYIATTPGDFHRLPPRCWRGARPTATARHALDGRMLAADLRLEEGVAHDVLDLRRAGAQAFKSRANPEDRFERCAGHRNYASSGMGRQGHAPTIPALR